MELKDLKALIKVITETDITEFNLEDADGKVQIKRGVEKEFVQVAAAPVPVASVAPAVPVAEAAAPAPVQEKAVNDKYEAITAPMVGTFYRRPTPDSDPYCKVGDIIEVGQALGLLEAMKLYNDIEAEFKCKVIEIAKEDATPVEFGETLFLVERL